MLKPTDSKSIIYSQGKAFPLGASQTPAGINFAVVIDAPEKVSLVFYLEGGKRQEIELLDSQNRTGNVWHVLLEVPDQIVRYGFRVKRGPIEDAIALDPYAKALQTPADWGVLSLISREVKWLKEPLSLYLPEKPFDWQGVLAPKHSRKDLVIYEMHVRGFTHDKSAAVQSAGQFLGVIEKIPYLKKLGINAVELLPVFEFFETEYDKVNPVKGDPLYNYWGYSPVSFFAPMNRYSSGTSPYAASDEFKMMVRELHRAGIEVILDVVYNHTAEGNEQGPLFSYKLLAPASYYLKSKDGYDMNFSGCGNSLNANHPVTKQMILDSLRYWVEEFQVDGFRFDLASLLNRGQDSEVMANPHLLADISEDPLLHETKLFGEPWDAGGLYELGSFSRGSLRWSEWNDRYRDAVRQFIHGFWGQAGSFATRLSGSEDFFFGRSPVLSLNYITCHDGFTLRDLVSYNQKHNLENGEDNRDGSNNNNSFNYGVEGPSPDPLVEAVRVRQMKNFLLSLFLSQGIPMLSMGDEFGHSQQGNNNTWCQDNDLSWLSWRHSPVEEELLEFTSSLIHFRLKNKVFRRETFLTSDDIDWHGVAPFQPNWGPNAQFCAFLLKDEKGEDIYTFFNASRKGVYITLPPPRVKGMMWLLSFNTAQGRKQTDLKQKVVSHLSGCFVEAHSALVLQAKNV
ncbi:MAG: putative isoamylase [Chlamydiales bacterium]|jgi:isoamylase/glycogen operon protein|nr:putative isoamylase [Chlamydiales bacterium]